MEEAGHHLPVDPTLSTSKTKRNYLKCDRCRNDRKPCDFSEGKPSCKRCETLHHRCSGAKRAEKNAGKKRKADDTADGAGQSAEEDEVTQTTTVEAVSADRDRSTPKRSNNCGRMLHAMVVNNTAQKLYSRTRSDLKNTMTFEEASIPHLVTSSCKKSQELLNHVNDRLKQLHDCSMSGFDGVQPQRRFTESHEKGGESSETIDLESGEHIMMLCTANIKPHEQVGAQCTGRVHNTFKELRKEYYLHTARAVKRLMASIPQDDSDDWAAHCRQYGFVSRNHGPFPAFVIAWLNLDFITAYDLWLDTVREGTVVDVLGRSFMHLVAESGDPRPLNKMPQNFLEYAKLDGRDLSLLDLAIIGDGSSIVIKLIEECHVLPPFTRAMQRAILGNRSELARAHLLPHLPGWSDGHELSILADLAFDHGFVDLSNEIKEMVPYRITPKDALTGLNVDISFIDELATVSNTPSGFPYLRQNNSDPQNHYATWNDFSAPSNTQSQRSRNDPGGGIHTHLFDPPYSAS